VGVRRDDAQMIFCASAADWERWLRRHHRDRDEVWLKIAKQGTGLDSARYPEVLDSALCHGWIDARREGLDERFFLQRFTPRGPRSRWSRINREKVEELERAGRLRPAGLREIERARADGRWEAAYESQSRATVPDDLQRELDRDPAARAFFESLESHNRYAILYRIHDAKRPETRARRIARFMEMLRAGERPHP
jgi:uncharacterized protein YdeI (YjbR/CyaY-like superfamily)